MGLFDKFKKKKNASSGPLWLYSEEELEAVEKHINDYFGSYENVFHELYSPDVHLDVVRIEPTAERNYYTFITLGAGAYQMDLPEGLDVPNRAEYIITLPPDWDVENMEEEKNFWPLGFLKTIGRMPISCDTFLCYGHTASRDDNNSPFASNTELCSIVLALPDQFDEDALSVTLPNGEDVVFYLMVPIYLDELELKMQCEEGMPEFESYLGNALLEPLDINRPSCVPKG